MLCLKDPLVEAWVAYAVYSEPEKMIILEEITANVDALNHAIPSPEGFAWAFTRLRKRRWLIEKNGAYRLGPNGRQAIESMVKGKGLNGVTELGNWMEEHPP